MSVFVSFRLDIRPYSGYADPSLPIAAWVAQGSTIGDASGGTMTIEFRIQTDGDPQISELYNLEQYQYDTSALTTQQVMLQARNMDTLAPIRPMFDQRWMSDTTGVGGTAQSAVRFDRKTMLPLWLGSPSRAEGDAGLRLITTNVLNLQYLATLQGYIWGPRSVLAAGGPQRPVGGLFGG